ncbi:MAG: hypothetical protein WD342_17675 [Verrucomicrobiales bacterium]
MSRDVPSSRLLCLAASALLLPVGAQDARTPDAPPVPDAPAVDTNPEESRPRDFIQIEPQTAKPSVSAMAPIDDSHVVFLNRRGQIGLAKFSPGLSLIGWDFYSEVKLDALPSLALGPGYSVIAASPTELTQAFDTDEDLELDFFQALVRDWAGREEGVVITAGPVADAHGRVLFALSPFAAKESDSSKARLVAWHPETEGLVTITESQLPIDAFALSSQGILAARLHMPEYEDGYYLSLTDLPPFDPEPPEGPPERIPSMQPSLLIPAELTRGEQPEQLSFFREDQEEKLLVTCPGAKQILEILPEKKDGVWQGAILLRQITTDPVETLSEMSPGLLVGGGDDGFVPVRENDEVFRISRVSAADDGIVLDFTRPVDRYAAVKPESYSVTEISLKGGSSQVVGLPVIESDGKSVILQVDDLKPGTVLRIVCQNVPSEDGKRLLSTAAFYTIHKRDPRVERSD